MQTYQVKRITDWLPTTRKEVEQREWDQLDVILFTGDAYVDHPAFGAAMIGRVLESLGLKVAIVPQPNWRDDLRDFKKLGLPRLFFAVSAGNMDSMVNHYTANCRLRSDDAYTPGGKAGFRPDYPTIVYSHILKDLYPEVPVVIGGIEASLRKFTHYDFVQDNLRPSVLVDSGADMLVYGMGEKPVTELVNMLQKNIPFHELQNIPQTAILKLPQDLGPTKHWRNIHLSPHEECLKSKLKFARISKIIEVESNRKSTSRILQKVQNKVVIVNPPYHDISIEEIDHIYALPFTRMPHPRYNKKGPIPAYEMIKFSVTSHRGCFGGCSFCTISAHQGKHIVSRSKESILAEIDKVTAMPGFKGYLSDIGGPSANMYMMKGKNREICDSCKRPSCIFPGVCKNLDTDHSRLTDLYKTIDNHPKIKKAFIGSGIRYDLFFDKDKKIANDKDEYAKQLIARHVSGRLKVAPEHTSPGVLKVMRKPSFDLFKRFKAYFDEINSKGNLNQQLVPYFISSHPGCVELDMAKLAVETKQLDFRLEQVQDFTPTPMTLATVMFYAGIDPYTEKKIYVARGRDAKLGQRKFFFWYEKEHGYKIKQSLEGLGRKDVIKELFR